MRPCYVCNGNKYCQTCEGTGGWDKWDHSAKEHEQQEHNEREVAEYHRWKERSEEKEVASFKIAAYTDTLGFIVFACFMWWASANFELDIFTEFIASILLFVGFLITLVHIFGFVEVLCTHDAPKFCGAIVLWQVEVASIIFDVIAQVIFCGLMKEVFYKEEFEFHDSNQVWFWFEIAMSLVEAGAKGYVAIAYQ